MLKIRYGDVSNFILIKYARDVLDNKPPWESIDSQGERAYFDVQPVLFDLMVKQIRNIYPKAKIHVLTNDPSYKAEGLVVHVRDFTPNHTAKYLLYGLLDEPAMYLDSDIILLKKFPLRYLQIDTPFTVFEATRNQDLQLLSARPLPAPTSVVFNAGIIWIARPSQQVVEAMQKLQADHFDDRTLIESRGHWFLNDEYAMSAYISMIGHQPLCGTGINVPRYSCDAEDIPLLQTVHYTGFGAKDKFMKELYEYHPGPI
jgi:hypothetical protein